MPIMGSRFITDGNKVALPSHCVCLPSAIVENMAEFRPEMCTEAAQQGLLQWLLKRLKVSVALGSCCSDLSALGMAAARCLCRSVPLLQFGQLLIPLAPVFAYLFSSLLKRSLQSAFQRQPLLPVLYLFFSRNYLHMYHPARFIFCRRVLHVFQKRNYMVSLNTDFFP